VYRIPEVEFLVPTGMIFMTASNKKEKLGWDVKPARF
jgi:hypothetical protein